MVPPTGASDSIFLAKRNGASLDPHRGAPQTRIENYSMEGNENRSRKSWGERWKANRSVKLPVESQMIETSNFMVHPDYLHKYGTLSNGVLTKSIKYAETWLYGTVAVRGVPPQRPSLFLYPGVVAAGPRTVDRGPNYATSPPGPFVAVPATNFASLERNGYALLPQNRKHSDPRFGVKPTEPKPTRCTDCGGDVRRGISKCKKCGEKRSATCRSTVATKSRPSLRDSASICENRTVSLSAADPYDLMRRSRLGVKDSAESCLFNAELSDGKRRNASASPSRRPKRDVSSPGFETFKPKEPENETKAWKSEDEDWNNVEAEIGRRKSILECDVNAYELNKIGNESRDDDGFGDETLKLNNPKLKILRPKLNKTDLRKSGFGRSELDAKGKNAKENPKKSEVRLNGQRFKIFDHSNPPTSFLVEGYVSDEDDGIGGAPTLERTLAPRSASPVRPPRRPKDKIFNEIGFKYSKSKSKSSPNLSIKSILKKPTGNEDPGLADTVFETEQISGTLAISPTENPTSRETTGRSAKNQSQNTSKKKKQVQFRVNNSYESLTKSSEGNETGPAECPDDDDDDGDDDSEETDLAEEPVHRRSESCENLSFAGKEPGNECFAEEKKTKTEETRRNGDGKRRLEDDERFGTPEDETLNQGTQLKRSYSFDRRPSSAIVLYKDDLLSLSTSPPNSYLFKDTMALRTRAARQDTRGVFVKEKRESKGSQRERRSDEKANDLASDSSEVFRSFQKNSSKLSGNFITYEEFSRLTDEPKSNKPVASDKTRAGKSKTSVVSNVPTKAKSTAPSPPPRQTSGKATKSKNSRSDSVGVEVSRVKTADPKKTLHNKSENRTNSSKEPMTPANPTDSRRTTGVTDGDLRESSGHSEGTTVVNLNPSLEIVNSETPVTDGKRAFVTIHPKNIMEETKSPPRRKTSVLITSFRPSDANKVTISVRNETTEEESKSSTCTIIETGSNSTVIPVVSTDNKTTLIVGSNTPVASPEVSNACVTFPAPPKPEKPTQYIFSTVNSDADKAIEFMDPVEAVRRNLIPHICGKEDNGPTLMEKIKQSRETKEQKHAKQISQLFENASNPERDDVVTLGPSESLLAFYKSKKRAVKNDPGTLGFEEDPSSPTSGSDACKSIGSERERVANLDLSPSSVNSKFYIFSEAEDTAVQERDKLECEYEIGNGFKEDKTEVSENIYETIKEEPLYDRIESKFPEGEDSEDDVPPPLPSSSPPSSNEAATRSAKSIFEGATKYDILNYLVDAKERVREESYLSESSAGEDADNRRSVPFEGSERSTVEDEKPGRILVPSPSEGLEIVDKLEKMDDGRNAPAENDSGIDLSSRVSNLSQASDSSEDNLILTVVPPDKDRLKLSRKSSAEIERNDSGVGSETSHTSRSKWQASSGIREDPRHLCEDCDQIVETQITDSGVMFAPLVCRKCTKRRSERKEIIQEIVETEEKYGRDLKIILEEFYKPMLVAGLLTPDQLSAIFLNTEELLENSEQLTEKLRDTLEIALEQGDEDLLTVNVGKLFLEAGPTLHAFENYCTRQGGAALLLASLEKEKELLRIFLRVSQMENAVLRRMNLNSFLMVPVQRVTKYPLLLARLYKVTPSQQEGRELLREAQHKIELHLEHMNSEAKDLSTTKVWRRFSTSTIGGRKSTAELEMINIKLRKMAVDILDWNHEEVRFVMEGKLLYTQPTDNNWKRGRTIKLTPVFVLLVTLGKPNSKYKIDPPDDELTFPAKTGIREATLLLVKEKCGRYTLIREPLYLDKIIVCCETDVDEYFEIQELSTKDSFIFKAEDGERTKEWYRQLQYHAQILGSWRRRRNALANIMINGMMARAYAS